jgi:asparagine synthase (glutamine-hydrolysing)
MLLYFDKTSMAHSLEVRVPFLDHRVVELCATIPGSQKVRRLQTKALLKHAARGVVPDRIIDKRKQSFLRAAAGGWFSAQLDGAVSDFLLDGHPLSADVLDEGAVRALIAAHAERRPGADVHLLLAVLLLEVWLATYLPRALGTEVTPRERVSLGA